MFSYDRQRKPHMQNIIIVIVILSEEFVKGRTEISSKISLNTHNKDIPLMPITPFHEFLIIDKSKKAFTSPSKLN